MATRQNIANITPAELASWRQAMTNSMGLQDNRGYVHFAGMHGPANQSRRGQPPEYSQLRRSEGLHGILFGIRCDDFEIAAFA